MAMALAANNPEGDTVFSLLNAMFNHGGAANTLAVKPRVHGLEPALDVLSDRDVEAVIAFILAQGRAVLSRELGDAFPNLKVDSWPKALAKPIAERKIQTGGYGRWTKFAGPEMTGGMPANADGAINVDERVATYRRFRDQITGVLIKNESKWFAPRELYGQAGLNPEQVRAVLKEGVRRFLGDMDAIGGGDVFFKGERVTAIRCINAESLRQYRESKEYQNWVLPPKTGEGDED
jgi:hypothetical protein